MNRGTLYSRVATGFMIITILAVVAILHFTLASATIIIPPKVENFVLETPIEIAKQAGPDKLYGEIATVTLEKSQSFPVTGKLVTSEKAGAVVTIINNTTKDQPLVKTTRFLSGENKLFRLTSAVVVPAQGQVSGYIEADQPRKDYEIGAGKFTIPGLNAGLQEKIYGQTDQATSFQRPEGLGLSQDDLDQAKNALLTAMKTNAIAELQKKIPTAANLIPDYIDATIINESFSPKLGTKTGNFTYTIKASLSTMIFDRDQLMKMTQTKLKEKLPTDAVLIKYNTGDFNYKLSDVNLETETALANVHLDAEVATGDLIRDFINPAILGGKTGREAETYLNEQGVKNAKVVLFPFWVRHVPRLIDHIRIETAIIAEN